jgi:hypothetical protein
VRPDSQHQQQQYGQLLAAALLRLGTGEARQPGKTRSLSQHYMLWLAAVCLNGILEDVQLGQWHDAPLRLRTGEA